MIGGEVDLDLGNYERFLDVTLHKDNNITTGKIFLDVINKERKGDYLGKTVQVVPHITGAIQDWVIRVSKIPVDDSELEPDVCVIELGGTIGDIESMSFTEAFRQFQFKVHRDNFCCVLVSLVPQPRDSGEQKTKPTQKTVRELRGLGLCPDLIFCRSVNKLTEEAAAKISDFCHVLEKQVISVPDVSSIYRVPLLLEEQNVSQFLKERLNLEFPNPKLRKFLFKWKELAEKVDHLQSEVVICLVGKYTKLEDAYTSVVKALSHAAMACNNKLVIKYVEAADLENETKNEDPVRYHEAWQVLCSADGVLIPGGFGVRGVEGKILAAGWAREAKKPLLGRIGTTLQITALPAGHMIGGTIWKIVKDDNEVIVYGVDYNHRKERHLDGCSFENMFRPHLFITDSFVTDYTRIKRVSKDEQFASTVSKTLRNVLVCVDTAGRVLEVAYLLEQMWKNQDTGLMAYNLTTSNCVTSNLPNPC